MRIIILLCLALAALVVTAHLRGVELDRQLSSDGSWDFDHMDVRDLQSLDDLYDRDLEEEIFDSELGFDRDLEEEEERDLLDGEDTSPMMDVRDLQDLDDLYDRDLEEESFDSELGFDRDLEDADSDPDEEERDLLDGEDSSPTRKSRELQYYAGYRRPFYGYRRPFYGYRRPFYGYRRPFYGGWW